MAIASSWTSNTTGRSDAVCSYGASTCIRTSWTEANLGRSFICCSDGCGWLHWIGPPISCPRCERLIPSLLKSNKENSDLKLSFADDRCGYAS
ncbi:hypothetical protein HanIR_Chr12g0588961 [Helianthus annuus]|nr:hypothetical protein HanIR_Chr12g0588961 [Helianthus annuus]